MNAFLPIIGYISMAIMKRGYSLGRTNKAIFKMLGRKEFDAYSFGDDRGVTQI